MPAPAKVRDDLEYYDQEIEDEQVVVVRDPVRNTWFRFNLLQAAMLRALDGNRSPEDVANALSVEFDVEIPPIAAERFVSKARDLMLVELGAYKASPAKARRQVRKELRKAGFQFRSPKASADRHRNLSQESLQFTEAFRELDRGHPRAAATHLQQVIKANPNNVRAKQLFDIIQTAYLRSFGGTSDYPTWVLFNPSRFLSWLSQKFGRYLFAWIGVVAILLWAWAGAYSYSMILFDHVEFGVFDIVMAYGFLVLGGLFHELGHGAVCQHYGGNVTEIGYILFYYFRLVPYCDTSSSYLITNRRHKVMVQLGGSIASIIWISGMAIALGLLAPTVPFYSPMAIAIVLDSAIFFLNLMPFLKIDGYYALADWVSIPNLRERSFKLAHAWISTTLFGIAMEAEELPARTRHWMIAFGIVSRVFTTCFVLFMYLRFIVTPLVEHFHGLGLIVAILLTVYLFRNMALKPIYQGLHAIWRKRTMVFTRRRSVVLGVLAVAMFAPWFLRWPLHVDTGFMAVPHERADIRAKTAGTVSDILVQEGEHVTAGQPVAKLHNPELTARLAVLEAEREAIDHRIADLRDGARPEELELAKSRLEQSRAVVRQRSAAASVANQLAQESLGTRSDADAANGVVAKQVGLADTAQWSFNLLRAGSRPEAIAMVEAEGAEVDAELADVRSDVSFLTLRSPIEGTVTTKHLGDLLQAGLATGDLFAEVHDTSRMVAELPLSATDPLSEIGPGDEIVMTPFGDPNHQIKTRIDHFHRSVKKVGDDETLSIVTEPFVLDHPITGLNGHARIYGRPHSLAYATFMLPIQRIISVRLWSMW